MPLTKLQFKPGINRETTAYTNTGGWFDMDKVRFRAGFPEKIGGWEKDYTTQSFLGVCRDMHPWRSLIGELLIGIGTSLKYYINEGGAFNDITPLRNYQRQQAILLLQQRTVLPQFVLIHPGRMVL